MPMRRPKPVKLPVPFVMAQLSADDNGRRRALIMNHELDLDEGYSWNHNRKSWWWRLWHQPLHKVFGSLLAIAMGIVVSLAFVLGMDSGIHPPESIIFMKTWQGNRSARDAREDQLSGLAQLKAEIAAVKKTYSGEKARNDALIQVQRTPLSLPDDETDEPASRTSTANGTPAP